MRGDGHRPRSAFRYTTRDRKVASARRHMTASQHMNFDGRCTDKIKCRSASFRLPYFDGRLATTIGVNPIAGYFVK